MKTMILVGGLLLAGCAQPDPTGAPVFHDPTLVLQVESPALQLMAGAAVGRIEAATGVQVQLNPAGATPLGARVVSVVWGELDYTLEDGTDVVGQYDYGTHTVSIDPTCPELALPTVVLHEIIHALGVAPHIGLGQGVMSPEVGSGRIPLTVDDLNDVCTYTVCTKYNPE